jgi:predicted amidohydrolase YtcJ
MVFRTFLSLVFVLVALSGCRPAPLNGDVILQNARIWTVNEAAPWAEALVVENGVIVYVGDEAGTEAYDTGDMTTVDAGGRVVLPGLHDVHQHTLEARLPLIDCTLDTAQTDPEQYVSVVSACSSPQGTDWVLGYGHTIMTLLEAQRAPRLILDDAISDVPVAIMEQSSHSTWVNSRALEVLGINASTPNPQGGLILKDANGEPNGILVDAAGEFPWEAALAPNATLNQLNRQALSDALTGNSEVGITSAVDARTYWQRGYMEAYTAARDANELTVRMVLSLWASPTADDEAQLATLAGMFVDSGDYLRVRQIKLYSDGLIDNTTAALLEPYTSAETFGDPLGLNYFPPERLNRYVQELAPLGFDMHIHAIGDRAIRESLNALETHGPGGRHHLTHAELITDADLPRFAQLGVSADFQLGEHTMADQLHDVMDEHLGATRVDEEAFRVRDLWDGGANVALSSDFDVGPLSPFAGMQVALTRGVQALPDVAAAVKAYTLNAAHIMSSEAVTGSLEVGKAGDFVVIDRDIFAIPAAEIDQTQVLQTVLAGVEVYRSADL